MRNYLSEAIVTYLAENPLGIDAATFETAMVAITELSNKIAYDNSTEVELAFDDETLLKAFKAAHLRNQTLNQFIEDALCAVIESEDREDAG